MARPGLRKFRGFPTLTPDKKVLLNEALSVGAPVQIACERAGIVRDTFYRWMRAGKALYLGEESPDIPHFLPRQPDERDETWNTRLTRFEETCAMLVDLYLTSMETLAEARFQAHKKMYERALTDDSFFPNAWFLERTMPENYALVTTNRRQVDVKAEVTHKHEVKLLAEAFSILGPANPAQLAEKPTITLPDGDAVPVDPDHD